MAHFHILEEVRTGNTGDWQLCFQCGTYEYDPDQDTPVPREFGYRFIYRRPNGQLQGARGQARLMPDLITILLGKAAAAGWYPVPPSRSKPTFASSRLAEAASLLRPKIQQVGDRARDIIKLESALPGLIPSYEFASSSVLVTEIFGLVQDDSDLTRELRGLGTAVNDAEALRASSRPIWQQIESAARAVIRGADLVYPLLDDANLTKATRGHRPVGIEGGRT